MLNKINELSKNVIDSENGIIYKYANKDTLEEDMKIIEIDSVKKIWLKITIYDESGKISILNDILNLKNKFNLKPNNKDLLLGILKCLRHLKTNSINYFLIEGEDNLKNPYILNLPNFGNKIYCKFEVFNIVYKKVINEENREKYILEKVNNYLNIGRELFKNANYFDANTNFKQALRNIEIIKSDDSIIPNLKVIIYNNLGLSVKKLQDYNKSLEYFNKSISINNSTLTNKKAFFNKAACLTNLKFYEEAEEIFKKIGFNEYANHTKSQKIEYMSKYKNILKEIKFDN